MTGFPEEGPVMRRILFPLVVLLVASACAQTLAASLSPTPGLSLPGATAPTASAQVAASASAAPSASVEPSGSRLPDARVELTVSTELEPNRDWTIAVTGG